MGQLNIRRAIASCAYPVSGRILDFASHSQACSQRHFGTPGKWDNSKPEGDQEIVKECVGNWTDPLYTYLAGCKDGSRVAERAHISKLKSSSVFPCKVCAIYD